MLAIEISKPGPPDVLHAVERPIPVPQADEIVIRVAAAGVARADLLQRQGHYPPPKGASDIPGLDVAGTVYAIGSAVQGRKVGDAVCAILTGGGYAEYCAVPSVQALPIPDGWSFVEAATLPENLFTVYDNVVTRGGLQAGETILIHGGSSGIGTMAIMVALALEAHPIVTAGTAEKCVACLQLGAEHAINYKETDFVEEVHKLTLGRGVDLVLDMVGGDYLDRNLDALAADGRLVIIAMQKGRTATLDIGKLMLKRLRVIGSTMRARPSEAKGRVASGLLRDIWPLLPAKNHIRPVIDSTFPLKDARLAHARMESGGNVGKIVLVADGMEGLLQQRQP
jgi:putative PIG3 family NAD(P)H quinone oxidoreductase